MSARDYYTDIYETEEWTEETYVMNHLTTCPSGTCKQHLTAELDRRGPFLPEDEIIASLQAIAVSLSDSNPSMST